MRTDDVPLTSASTEAAMGDRGAGARSAWSSSARRVPELLTSANAEIMMPGVCVRSAQP